VRSFRNLTDVEIHPATRFNLIYGENGHGKTSLIEALYVVATTKSFRSQKLGDTIQQGKTQGRIVADVEILGLKQNLAVTLGARSRSFLIDEKRPARLFDYALKTPIIAFHPGDLLLASGPAQVRRSLLDRVLIHQDPAGTMARSAYKKALADRQKVLSDRGPAAQELDAYEQLAARYGARFSQGRRRAAESVSDAVLPAFTDMAAPGLACAVTYQAGGCEDVETFRKELLARREKDMHRGASSFGPQKDELVVTIDSRPARTHASQGQQRLVTLAMKLAELSCIRRITGLSPLLLLDDVSSELDPERTHAVFELLRRSDSQIFVTTTRPELFSEVGLRGPARADFEVRNGAVSKS
jgi:DNA replication and repair protein RecF